MHPDFDLLIVGAGPAGASLALKMAGNGLRIGVVEKEITPGNKICGDALGGMVFNVLKRMPGDIYRDFFNTVPHLPSHGIRFTSPGHTHADIPFRVIPDYEAPPPGCLCRRIDFDHFLSRHLHASRGITLMRGVTVDHLQTEDQKITAHTSAGLLTSRVVAGADGVHSVVRRSFLPAKISPRHLSVGIRAYFNQVAVDTPGNHIELIFLKRVLPGYFWIFPLPGGIINAGFGLLQEQVLRKKTAMTALFNDLIMHDPILTPRFSNAVMIGKPGAHVLPLGTFTPPRSGNRFILLGDAASLVDPFSGEGIGNAMASAETAATVLIDCFRSDDFSAASLQTYDKKIEQRFGQSFQTSRMMQRLANKTWLLNFVIGKVSRNEELRHLFTAMYTNESIREKLRKPSFYAGLLLK